MVPIFTGVVITGDPVSKPGPVTGFGRGLTGMVSLITVGDPGCSDSDRITAIDFLNYSTEMEVVKLESVDLTVKEFLYHGKK